MPRKPGRTLDRKQTNRRQKHELDYRAAKHRCSRLAVILADLLEHYSSVEPDGGWIEFAKRELRRANREARKA